MPSPYQPDPEANPVAPWLTAFLSQRDLSLRVPLNYITYPGISITKACFGKNIFDDSAAVRCFSNLFATGFRRFDLDLYWDEGRRVWSFCPIQLPKTALNGSLSIKVPNGKVAARSIYSLLDKSSPLKTLHERQTIPTVSTSTSSGLGTLLPVDGTILGGTATRTKSPLASATAINNGTLVNLGPYSCNSIDLHVFTAVLAAYLENSQNTLQAIITYLTLNLHVAAKSPSGTAPQILNTSALPIGEEQISNILSANLSTYLYTPTLLREERVNLNSSWYAVADAQPQAFYFNTTPIARGDVSSENGWPTEAFVEFNNKDYRLMAEIGKIDPQLRLYNFSNDDAIIFSANSIQSVTTAQLSSSENKGGDCFFKPYDTTISSANNSWAVSTQIQLPHDEESLRNSAFSSSVANLTACGISPLLNETLFNKTADEDYQLYQNIAYSSIWSWSVGEPRNISTQDDSSGRIRCATFDGSANGTSGRWRVADCTEHHRAVCRVSDEPYAWRISSDKAAYSAADEICPTGSSFSVPRTALENRYLLSAVAQRSGEDTRDQVVWLNLNSLDVTGCWVTGVRTRCPYRGVMLDTRRTVVVPTVAAVIIFVIAALTVFIKCAANRQKSRRGRRRRRTNDGWEYEGVPS